MVALILFKKAFLLGLSVKCYSTPKRPGQHSNLDFLIQKHDTNHEAIVPLQSGHGLSFI